MDLSRLLAGALEPVAAQVLFAPEAHAEYVKLGFAPSPGPYLPGSPVAGPERKAYFTSRGSVMGRVRGEVVAAAFGVFKPEMVIAGVEFGWSLTSPQAIRAARDRGSIAQLVRILGERPEGLDRVRVLAERAVSRLQPAGKPLFAGQLSLGLPGHPLGDVWRLLETLREYRGDAHTAAWTASGYDAVTIGIITEYWWGLTPRTYVRSRGWSDEDLDAGQERMASRGWWANGQPTEQGMAAREDVETATDGQCRPIVDALGTDDTEALIRILTPWSRKIREAGGYPTLAQRPVSAAR
jgi:hypothetical protein